MADVFANTTLTWGGAFTADQGLVSADSGIDGILLQNIGLNYAQNISRIYEIGNFGSTPHVYYVGGRSQGTMQLGHVVGPGVSIAAFYTKYSDVCQANTNSIVLDLTQSTCGLGPPPLIAAPGVTGVSNTGLVYTAKFVVLTQIGMTVNANDLVINENSQSMFSNLSLTVSGNGT